MVVLAAAIISKSGKALVSRQYVDISSIRMEGLLATFPKLVGTSEQHAYVETHNVRYVYQPMESLYLLLVTNKQSNILEDRETLRLLSKLVSEYVPSLDEEGICRMAFELIFAFDEVISLGYKENATNAEIDPYVEMGSHEERLRKRIIDSKINDSKDIMKHKANDIEQNRIEKSKGDKGSFASSMPAMGSSGFDNGLGYPNSSMGVGMRTNSSGFGSGLDTDVYKSKARPITTSASSIAGMQLGKSTNTNHFFEGEVIVGDVAPRPIRSAAAASLMGVHILDDETEMFFSRQVSNASSIVHNAGAVPFTLEVDPRRPSQSGITRQDVSVGPLTPPPGSRPVSGILYPGQFGNGSAPSGLLYYGPPSGRTGAVYPGQLDMGPDAQYSAGGIHFSEMLFKKLVRAAPTGMQYDGVKAKKRGEGSSETLDRHFGHYSSDMRYDPDNDSVSPTSTLDHHDTTESSPSTESDRFYPSRNPNLTRYLDAYTPKGRQETNTRPSSQLAQCLLSLTAMADDTTDEDDIIFEQPSTSAPLWHTPPERPVEPHLDWPIVQFQAPPSRPHHRHPQSSSNSPKNGRTLERWSSNSSSWNLSLLAKPKATVTKVPVSGSGSKPKRHSKRHSSNGDTLREIHNGASSSTVLTYDRSGDAHGRHKWERDSSSSSPSVEEIGFEAYDRPGEQMVHTLDEEDFPFSPIASSFVFGEHNNSVEFSQRGGRNGIPRAVGPIVHEFASSNFEIQDFQESMSTASEGSHTYSLESGFLQPELDWVPTKSFHYIKGPSVEIVELGTSNRVFNGYIEINHSGRFSIDLQRGPRLERHLSSRYNIEKTPDVLLRIVEEAHSMSSRRRSNATKYANCRCLPVPKKGLLGRCLTSNQTHGVAVANSFESRLRSRSLG